MKKILSIILTLMLTMCYTYAQDMQVKGKITSSDDGSPMIGVSVLDQFSGNYAVSDDNGNYSITVQNKSQKLLFQFLGYRDNEVEINSRKTINVTLFLDVMSIDGTMVIAYGQGKKSSFTGSATIVKKEDIQKIASSNVTSALQGLSAGVQVINSSGEPGANATVLIRGIGSMNASSSPLYVVDGVPYYGSISSMSTNDINSITVLKDASATALYGSRAANGVIVITTKKGQSEEGQINFKVNISFPKLATSLPRKLTPQEYTETTWSSQYQGFLEQGNTDENARNLACSTVTQILGINPWDSDTPVGINGKINPGTQLLFQGDWIDESLNSSPRQEYTLDFNGKKGKTDYYISGNYVKDNGLFTTSSFERYSARVNVNSQIKKWLKVGTNTTFAHCISINNSGASNIRFLRVVPSIYPIYQYDKTSNQYKTDANGEKLYDYGIGTRKEWGGWNPLADAEYNKAISNTDNFSTRDYIELTLLPKLKFTSNISIDYNFAKYDSYTSADHGWAVGMGGNAYKSDTRYVGSTWNNLLTYNKEFGKHSFNLLAGQEVYQVHNIGLSGSKEGFPFGGLYEFSSAADMTDLSSYVDNYKLLSFFGRAEYNYNDIYYISASLRSDGSSRFSKASRWGTFWSVGTSWRLSQEKFLKDIKWIDNLKVKASYGAVGNDNLSTYYAYQGLYATGYDDFGKAGIMIQRLPNESLKWETNLQFNVGVDYAFLNRITGSFEYFSRKSKDLLFPMPMAISTGISSIDRNIGDVKNSGIEMEVNGIIVDNHDFNWSLNINATHYENVITKLPQDEMYSGVFKWKEGESRYNFWGAEYAGVNPDNGNDQWWKKIYEERNGEQVVVDKVKTENSSEVIGDDQKQYLGDALPDLYGSITNSFKYKDIDFSFMFYCSIGGKLYDTDYQQMMSYKAGFSWSPDVLDAWTPDNHTTNTRFTESTAVSSQQFSSKWIFDNTFVRLRNITIGYTLPTKLLKKYNIKKFRIYASADNILTFAGSVKRGTDPEQSISGTTDNRFPPTKSISLGIELTL
ncbi:MAG: TonB-dependent receptor [Bacteroidales bacterium]